MSPSSDTQAMCPGTGHGIGEEANGVLEISEPLGARKPFVIGGPEPDVQFVTGSVIDLWRVPGLEAQAERRVGCLDSLAKRRDPVPDQTADQCQQTIALVLAVRNDDSFTMPPSSRTVVPSAFPRRARAWPMYR